MQKRPVKLDFQLSLCPACLKQLNEAACRSKPAMDKELAAMKAGAKIADGFGTIVELEEIANWKSARRRALLRENTDTRALKAVLDVARGDAPAQDKLNALCTLKGVGPRMASAILTSIDSTRYTVIDVRALDALGIRRHVNDAAVYPGYLAFCIESAARAGMALRDFDRALWKAGSA